MSIAKVLWRFYRVIVFPFLYVLSGGGTPSGCRHQPSCSVYGLQVIEQKGWIKGSVLALRRILSCHPWGN